MGNRQILHQKKRKMADLAVKTKAVQRRNDGQASDDTVAPEESSASIIANTLKNRHAHVIIPQMERFLAALNIEERRVGCSATATESSTGGAITQLKEQMDGIQELRDYLTEHTAELFDAIEEKTEGRLRGLLDSFSLLLSLDAKTLKHAMSFLDEQSLLSLEEASETIKLRYSRDALQTLHRLRQQKFGYVPILPGSKGEVARLGARRRAKIFAVASDFAERMEHVAAHHYDYDQQKAKRHVKEKKSGASKARKIQPGSSPYEDMIVKCKGCQKFSDDRWSSLASILHDEYDPNYDQAIFVRLSYRQHPVETSSTGLIWQGFVENKKSEHQSFYRRHEHFHTYEYACSDDESVYSDGSSHTVVTLDLSEAVKDMEWPELQAFLNELEKRGTPISDKGRMEKKQQMEDLVHNLTFTAVLLSSPYDRDPDKYLLMATGGVARGRSSDKDTVVSMQPRNKVHYHGKKWDESEFIETRISIKREGKFNIEICDDRPFSIMEDG